MDISFRNFSSISTENSLLFKNFNFSSLTPLQIKVMWIATVILSVLAVACFVKIRRFTVKLSNLENQIALLKIKLLNQENQIALLNKKQKTLELKKESNPSGQKKDGVDIISQGDARRENIIKTPLNIRLFEDRDKSKLIPLERKIEMAKKVGKDLIALNLCCEKKITDQQLQDILDNCPNIQFLDLEGCSSITSSSLKFLSLDLKELSLGHCDQLTNEVFKYLQPLNLQKLRLDSCKWLTNDDLQFLPQGLKGLSLIGCKQLTSEAFKHLQPLKLQELNLSHCEWVTDDVSICFSNELKSLILHHCNKITDACIKNLPKNLNELSIDYCKQLTGESFKHLQTINLHKLSLWGCSWVNEEMLTYLPIDLQELDLRLVMLTSVGLKHLPKTLKVLKCSKLTDGAIEHIPSNIQVLYLWICNITDHAIPVLPKTIQELFLFKCKGITDLGIQMLPSHVKLTKYY